MKKMAAVNIQLDHNSLKLWDALITLDPTFPLSDNSIHAPFLGLTE